MPILAMILIPHSFYNSNSQTDVTPSCETMHDFRVNVTHIMIERICTATASRTWRLGAGYSYRRFFCGWGIFHPPKPSSRGRCRQF